MSEKLIQLLGQLRQRGHKGQHGRIGVVGGCHLYTGAPYYAAMASLRAGAELASVFTAPSAAQAIKTYSPELMVVPEYDIDGWEERLHVLIVGPGLGRDEPDLVRSLLERDNQLPMIIDADGLFLLNNHLSLLSRMTRQVILTPNKPEFERLKQATTKSKLVTAEWAECDQANVAVLASTLKCTIMLKGEKDVIGDVNGRIVVNNEPGSNRRCGGQGDLLVGVVASHFHLAKMNGETDAEASVR